MIYCEHNIIRYTFRFKGYSVTPYERDYVFDITLRNIAHRIYNFHSSEEYGLRSLENQLRVWL